MNWPEVSAILAALTLLAVLLGGAAVYGSLTEKVSALTKRADGADASIASLDVRINTHDVQIGRLEEWKAGYNAAVNAAGRQPAG